MRRLCRTLTLASLLTGLLTAAPAFADCRLSAGVDLSLSETAPSSILITQPGQLVAFAAPMLREQAPVGSYCDINWQLDMDMIDQKYQDCLNTQGSGIWYYLFGGDGGGDAQRCTYQHEDAKVTANARRTACICEYLASLGQTCVKTAPPIDRQH